MYLGGLVDVDMVYQGAAALEDCPHPSRMIRHWQPQPQAEATFINN